MSCVVLTDLIKRINDQTFVLRLSTKDSALRHIEKMGLGPGCGSLKGCYIRLKDLIEYKDILGNIVLPTLWQKFGDNAFLFNCLHSQSQVHKEMFFFPVMVPSSQNNGQAVLWVK